MFGGFCMKPIASDQTRCPNCYDPMPDVATVTATGVLVCCEPCAHGWMNGERSLRYLAMVKELKALLPS